MSSWKDIFPVNNRFFETENGILYHGDCYGILKDIDKSQVHLLLTAPPYNITTGGGGVGRKRSFLKEITHDKLDKGVNYSFLEGFNNWIVFCSKKQLPTLLNIATNRKGCNWDLLTMLKKNPAPFTNNTFLMDTEYIIFSRKPKRLFGNYHDKHKYKEVAIKRNTKLLHPIIKPLEVITWLLNIGSQENEIVIDIFAGSGTTAIACESLNRKWVCIEKELKYCKIIRERL